MLVHSVCNFDWKQALQKQKDNPPAEVKNPTVRESLSQIRKTLSDYQKHRISHSKLMKEIEQWKPREIDPSEIKREAFKAYSPEKEVDALLKNWLNKNYGNIAAQQHQFASKDVNLGKEAGKVRSELHDKILKEGEIISIKDESPAVSVIVIRVKYEFNGALMEKEIALRMICNSESGETAINGQENIKWRFINKFMYDLYF